MKNLKTIAFLCTLFVIIGDLAAQKIEGRMNLSGFPTDGKIKENTAVDLFKSFRDGKYKINMSYKAENLGKRGLVLFDLKTTVKYNGKVIAQTSRTNWPFLPGDMFIPIEAFDLIPALQKHTFDMPIPRLSPNDIDVPLPKGKYDVSLTMVGFRPESLASPRPLNFSFVVE